MVDTSLEQVREPKLSSRERPWLVPYNRKLRHLKSIAVRNLALQTGHDRPRRTTNDDEALPHALRSPTKLLALRESKTLTHSHSSSDLRPSHKAPSEDDNAADGEVAVVEMGAGNGSPRSPRSRRPAQRRRRSTMEWAAASSESKQKKLESVAATRMADVFFSLHVAGVKEPIYVSEVVEKTTNPTFRHIDLEACGPAITRADSLTVKIWIKSERMSRYEILLDMSLNFRSLQFIGKELAAFNQPFPHNCVLLQLMDGYYTCFTDAQVRDPVDPFASYQTKASPIRPLPTASFDALLRLSRLDDSIQDAMALQDQLSTDLNRVVEQNREPLSNVNRVAEMRDYQKTIDYAKVTVEKQLKALRKTRDQKRSGLEERRKLMTSGRKEHAEALPDIANRRNESEKIREQNATLKKSISQQRRRICEDVQSVIAIKPMPDRSLAFTIRGLHLPNSEDLDSSPPESVSAALGHIAQVVQLLSFYLSQPLPYPVRPHSSTSSMADEISLMKTPSTSLGTSSSSISATLSSAASLRALAKDPSRIFPLFSRGVPRFRFEYAIFLLNKDIELLLSNAFGVRVLDIRQTLPNLLYALYCATAGEGELPARKAGGVRGLVRSGKLVGDAERKAWICGSSDHREKGVNGDEQAGHESSRRGRRQ